MTNTQVLQWIKPNLGPVIRQAIAAKPGTIYTEDWIAAIACRETGEDIAKHFPGWSMTPEKLFGLSSIMRGDWTKRDGETEEQPHGFGFWQIDKGSFPLFIKSGDWKDPFKCCLMALVVLENKRTYLHTHFPSLAGDQEARAVTAAYNCGEGNVIKVLEEKHDIDIRTTGKNYSAQVWQFRSIYSTL